MISTEKYREELEAMLLRYTQSASTLTLVDELPFNFIPNRITRVSKLEKKIFLLKSFPPEAIEGMIGTLGKFDGRELETLLDEARFVKFNVLMEYCHIIRREMDDYACHKWALYELKKN